MANYIEKVKVKHPPGTHFAYKSIDTQILGYCLEQALGKSIVAYLEEKIWQPLGMEYDAYMTLDHPEGLARTHAGVAACTRDLAKIGRLFLHKGKWNGEQIIPEKWVEKCREVRQDGGGSWKYATGWWLRHTHWDRNLTDKQDFYADGHDGQYIYVNPETNVIIVRQGKSKKANYVRMAARLSHLLGGQKLLKTTPLIHQYSGVYQSQDGEQITLSQVGKNWLAQKTSGDLAGKLHFIIESPQSLFNAKKKTRLIFEIESGEKVKGLFFASHQDFKFFEKVTAKKSK